MFPRRQAASRASETRVEHRTEVSLVDMFEPGSLNGIRTGDSARLQFASIAADSSGIHFRDPCRRPGGERLPKEPAPSQQLRQEGAPGNTLRRLALAQYPLTDTTVYFFEFPRSLSCQPPRFNSKSPVSSHDNRQFQVQNNRGRPIHARKEGVFVSSHV